MDSKARTSRTWSLSRKSKNNTPIKLTVEEKRRSKMTSNVDPTRAITEEEPFAVSQSKPSDGLRGLQHKDIYGNPIAEPDLSNPTRSRWERPLETIRSFEAAINNDAKRQSAFYVVDTIDNMDHSQKQIQHNPGPFDPSLYHRNNGGQRYAPVDAYDSRNHYPRQNSQDSVMDYGRPVMPAARGYGDRRSPSRTPPLANPYYNRSTEQYPPIQEGRAPSMRNRPPPPAGDFRKYPDQGYHQYSASTGSAGHDSYQYNSDPASESSSVGSNNGIPPPPPVNREYDRMFSFSSNVDPNPMPPLSSPTQLDGQGGGYSNGYTNGEGQMYGNKNPYMNGNANGPQQQQPTSNVYNTQVAANYNASANGGGLPNPTTQRKASILRKPIPLSSSTPAGAPAPTPPEKEKKKGFFKRLSKA